MARRKKYVFQTSFLSKYYEIEKIGEGGNSTVYKVKDDDEKEYALKLLSKKHNKESIKRFKNEIGYCMRAKHDNIMKVIDNGIIDINDEKMMFYVMPLYKKNLKELMKLGIKNEKKLFYFNQILEGIKYFHNGGNYHRDIKPENILYDETNDRLIIADLGISHFNKEEMNTLIETKINSRLANFIYAAPEQKEKEEIVDERADIYALGLILNELFTGRVPLGTNYKKIQDVDSNYSFLDDIVELMIKQDMKERPKNIEEVQFEINSRIQLNNINKELKKLKEIEIKENNEKDPIIIYPPKIIDVKYDEQEFRLRFKLSQSINQLWINCIKSQSWSYLSSYNVDKFNFEHDLVSVYLPLRDVEYAKTLTNYLKQWISNANLEYPKKVKENYELNKKMREKEIKEEIEKKEKIKNAIQKIEI